MVKKFLSYLLPVMWVVFAPLLCAQIVFPPQPAAMNSCVLGTFTPQPVPMLLGLGHRHSKVSSPQGSP